VPELPDVTVYAEAIARRVVGERLARVRVSNPFLLRTVRPPLEAANGRMVVGTRRLGKRIVLALEDDLFLVVHLMIAGRLHWRGVDAKAPGRAALALFDFPDGTLVLTEQGSRRRAALHVVAGEAGLAELDRGGIEPLEASAEQFAEALRRESHTVKRSLTDPRLFSGIGNAYSDEILHRAGLSPVRLTRALGDEEIVRLHGATRDVLREWIARLTEEAGQGFPEKVTAFRPEFAAHGKFDQPCPVCGTPIQRLVYSENECNYCPTCQTGGKLLADRSLSRLLKSDWPRTLEELEQRRAASPLRRGSLA
jgi:formamidopyrimidine-DNA glycosylase